MKNSIEGAIDRLEYVNRAYDYNNHYSRYDLDCIEILLSDYKRVLKENEELNLKYYMLYTEKIENLKAQEVKIKSQVIPVQKVKDIIERIDYDIKKTKEIISNNSNIYTSNRKNDYQIVRLRAMNTKSLDIKNRLQELLEGEVKQYE